MWPCSMCCTQATVAQRSRVTARTTCKAATPPEAGSPAAALPRMATCAEPVRLCFTPARPPPRRLRYLHHRQSLLVPPHVRSCTVQTSDVPRCCTYTLLHDASLVWLNMPGIRCMPATNAVAHKLPLRLQLSSRHDVSQQAEARTEHACSNCQATRWYPIAPISTCTQYICMPASRLL